MDPQLKIAEQVFFLSICASTKRYVSFDTQITQFNKVLFTTNNM